MDSKQDLAKYVTEHIDSAIEKEDIKIYYQPIIRALTGEVCGKEALARWDDPEHGLMEPKDFIPVLEENKLIHKLDSFVIKKICGHYNHCENRKDPLIPISFNLSWLDFELCDVLSVINTEVEKNRVPREMIRIEINENLIVHDRELIGRKIKELSEEGYDIIMDDYGSGHSSLNILKSFIFDELKVDMRILWGEDERSKKLIEYLVSMAKSVGVKTVAESVETKEQVEFLTNIGCEKLQGFYFGKPMFYWDLVPYLREKGMSVEPVSLQSYYDRIVQTDIREKQSSSYAIVEFEEERSHYLYLNEEYSENVKSIGITDLIMLESLCNDTESSLNSKFRQMIKRSKERKTEQVMNFVRNGNYCIVKFSFLAGTKRRDAYEVELVNLSRDSRVNHLKKINDALEGVYSVFDRVVQYDLTKDRVSVLHRDTGYTEKYDSNSFSDNINRYINNEIYADDRERYRQFADMKNVEERISKSGRSYIAGCFRFKSQSGNYVWREQYIILSRGNEEERKLLFCTKEVDEKQLALILELSSFIYGESDGKKSGKQLEISDSLLWKTTVETCPVGVFWKDMNRRFLGVNKAFLEYYGFESEDQVLGKTDEEMNWHVDPVPFMEAEKAVLNNGAVIRDSVGKCLARGENRDILVNKTPIYKDGRIVGLLGYFRDITERTNQFDQLKTASMIDEVTGVLNIKGLMDAVIRYANAYQDNKKDFAMAVFHIDQYRAIKDEYGAEHSNKVMMAVAEKLRKRVGSTAVLGRPDADVFLVIRQVESREEGPSFMQTISNDISSVRMVDNIPCTLYSSAGYASYSESGSQEALYSAAMKRMNDQMERMRRFTGGF